MLKCPVKLTKEFDNEVNYQLIDPQGRQISYLRVSLTDRCNFRCFYCYTDEQPTSDDTKLLRDDDLIKLIDVFVKLGINKIRLTGGEPLLRNNLVHLVRRISENDKIRIIGLTTNGYLLKPQIQPLIDAGLNRLNISLDTLKRDVFSDLTGYDGLNRVLDAIDIAEKSGAFPYVKVNTLLIKGFNDNEVNDFAHWALNRKIDLRFIEFMPTRSGNWTEEKLIPESDLREMLDIDLVPDFEYEDVHSPARSYQVEGHPCKISFISAMSRSFCKSCNRLRLTSQGKLIGCLYGTEGIDIMQLLTEKKSVDEIANFVQKSIAMEGVRQIPSEKGAIHQPLMKSIGG